MFLSEVSADGVADLQLTAASFLLYPGSGLLTNQWLADAGPRPRSDRTLGGSSACGRKRTSILENRIVEIERCRPSDSSRKMAEGRASTRLCFGWSCFRDAAVERANRIAHACGTRIRRYRARHVGVLPRKYSYELSDRGGAVTMHLDLRISDAAAVTTNRR